MVAAAPRWSSVAPTLALVAAFSLLWLPLGQQPFLVEHWMKIGTFMAPFALLAATAERAPSWLKQPAGIALLLLLAYIAHQFEEHWIDWLGNEYAFYESVNCLLLNAIATGCEATPEPWPLTPAAIFIINTSLVWLVGCIALIRGGRQPFTLLAMAAITLVNGLAHIVLAALTVSYNPGLLTSLLVFVPLSAWVYRRMWRIERVGTLLVIASLVWSVLAHALMVGGLLLANWFQRVPEWSYFVALILWSLLPAVLFPMRSGYPTEAGDNRTANPLQPHGGPS